MLFFFDPASLALLTCYSVRVSTSSDRSAVGLLKYCSNNSVFSDYWALDVFKSCFNNLEIVYKSCSTPDSIACTSFVCQNTEFTIEPQ